jgi:hypothetical protein
MTTTAAGPHLLHAIPGRVRIHVPRWSGEEGRRIEARLNRARGVFSVQASQLTHNVLIRYDPRVTSPAALLDLLRHPSSGDPEGPSRTRPLLAGSPVRPVSGGQNPFVGRLATSAVAKAFPALERALRVRRTAGALHKAVGIGVTAGRCLAGRDSLVLTARSLVTPTW